MVLIFYKTAKYLGFMRFSSMQKRLNLAAFGLECNNSSDWLINSSSQGLKCDLTSVNEHF